MIQQARIPQRYAHCTLEEYVTNFSGANRSLGSALVQARSFVKAYPFETNGNGLLLTGSIGVGKTHLAVGMLQALVADRGAKGLFFDYRDLLKQIQNSYNRNVDVTELEILQPVFEAEVLVLDELGASKPTDWVWDTVAHILNTRYNDRRTTIITTNYRAHAVAAAGDVRGGGDDGRGLPPEGEARQLCVGRCAGVGTTPVSPTALPTCD
jgi:DNA replication protein DnaC